MHIKDPPAQFRDLFDGTVSSPTPLRPHLQVSSFLSLRFLIPSQVKVNHASLAGTAEVKGIDPVQTVRKSSIISLFLPHPCFSTINFMRRGCPS